MGSFSHGVSLFSLLFSAHVKPRLFCDKRVPKRGLESILQRIFSSSFTIYPSSVKRLSSFLWEHCLIFSIALCSVFRFSCHKTAFFNSVLAERAYISVSISGVSSDFKNARPRPIKSPSAALFSNPFSHNIISSDFTPQRSSPCFNNTIVFASSAFAISKG